VSKTEDIIRVELTVTPFKILPFLVFRKADTIRRIKTVMKEKHTNFSLIMKVCSQIRNQNDMKNSGVLCHLIVSLLHLSKRENILWQE
jgi:branched-subunit amino acid transport protein AzlD